jgi:hypothetical protein
MICVRQFWDCSLKYFSWVSASCFECPFLFFRNNLLNVLGRNSRFRLRLLRPCRERRVNFVSDRTKMDTRSMKQKLKKNTSASSLKTVEHRSYDLPKHRHSPSRQNSRSTVTTILDNNTNHHISPSLGIATVRDRNLNTVKSASVHSTLV